jgi:large subunit ribosomal protein L18
MFSKIQRRNKIKARIRGRISGTAERPRMTVFRSNKQIYVQLVDDLKGTTLVAASSKGIEEGDKTAIAATMRSGAEGIKVQLSGRLNRRFRPQRLSLPRTRKITR